MAEIARVAKQPAPDAVSIDSGIDVQNARLSGLSTDSENSWIRTQAYSTESDVMEGDLARSFDNVMVSQSIPELATATSVDSGVVEEEVVPAGVGGDNVGEEWHHPPGGGSDDGEDDVEEDQHSVHLSCSLCV